QRPGGDQATGEKNLLNEINEGIKKTQTTVNTIQERIDKLPPQQRPGGDQATTEKNLVGVNNERIKKTQTAVNTIQERIDKLPPQQRPGGDQRTVEKHLGELQSESRLIWEAVGRIQQTTERIEKRMRPPGPPPPRQR